MNEALAAALGGGGDVPDEMRAQAEQIWGALDEMASSDPAVGRDDCLCTAAAAAGRCSVSWD